MNDSSDCCKKEGKKPEGLIAGIIYGLLPHTGCIAFITFTVIGLTTATAIFRPLLMSPYFFYILILMSFIFATLSAVLYLKKRNLLSFNGLKKKWKYLSVLYGVTIGVNLLLFIIVFPLVANIGSGMPTGAVIGVGLSDLTLKVKIPCPGHAPLISEELKAINGVVATKFVFPNYFEVNYDSRTSKQGILSLDIFNTYPAEVVDETPIQKAQTRSGCGCGSSICSSNESCCGG